MKGTAEIRKRKERKVMVKAEPGAADFDGKSNK